MSADLLALYPRQASHDEDSALRLLLCRALAGGEYRTPGSAPLRTWVVDDHPDESTPEGAIEFHSEWADGEHRATFPHVVIQDAEGSADFGSMAPTVDESTAWPEGDIDAGRDYVALRLGPEYVVEFAIMFEATDKPTRAALIRGARGVLEGAENTGRYGIIVEAGDLYYGLRARFTPLRMSRVDAEDKSGARHRTAGLAVRASIRTATPRVYAGIGPATFTGPVEGEYDTLLRGLDP